jgi:hypothetical protein
MRLLLCLALTLAGCSSSASEREGAHNQQSNQPPSRVEAGQDIVAVYRMNGPDGSRIATMTVEADESGAARIEMQPQNSAPPQVGWSTESGDVIMTAATPAGAKLVRASDMAAVSEEMMTRMGPPGALPASPFEGLRLEAAGSETVNGRTGIRYVIRFGWEKANKDEFEMDFVIAEDPALALIGRATSHTLGPPSAVTGSLTPPAFRELQQRMRSGAALRVGAGMVLESVENRPIKPERLMVAGTPISRGELREIMLRAIPPELARELHKPKQR